MKKRLITLLVAMMIFSANAEKLSDAERQIFDKKLQTLQTEYLRGNMGAMYDLVPPRFFVYTAKKVNADVELVKEAMKRRANTALKNSEIKSFTYNLDNVELLSSAKRRYTFVPYTNVFKQLNNEITVNNYILLLEDDNQWYTLTWQDKMAVMVYDMYPDLQGIKPRPEE